MRAALLVTSLLISSGAYAQGADVGLVNLVVGESSYTPRAGTRETVRAFMRVREGDRFTLPAAAQVRVVFFDGARQELWVGPGSFRASRSGSEPISGKPREITNLPAAVPQRMARIPDLIQTARMGGVQVRGLARQAPQGAAEKPALSEARALYARLRRDAAADDIAPELYLYSVLDEHALYPEMKDLVAAMLRRQPASDDLEALATWVERKISETTR